MMNFGISMLKTSSIKLITYHVFVLCQVCVWLAESVLNFPIIQCVHTSLSDDWAIQFQFTTKIRSPFCFNYLKYSFSRIHIVSFNQFSFFFVCLCGLFCVRSFGSQQVEKMSERLCQKNWFINIESIFDWRYFGWRKKNATKERRKLNVYHFKRFGYCCCNARCR